MSEAEFLRQAGVHVRAQRPQGAGDTEPCIRAALRANVDKVVERHGNSGRFGCSAKPSDIDFTTFEDAQ
ncbi:MAG: hypothetical protein GY871_04075 [Actinomycetales bacterium]|nr:hypothetical protein [Actinomycetales bacterium]